MLIRFEAWFLHAQRFWDCLGRWSPKMAWVQGCSKTFFEIKNNNERYNCWSSETRLTFKKHLFRKKKKKLRKPENFRMVSCCHQRAIHYIIDRQPVGSPYNPPQPALPYPHTTTVQHCNYNAQVRIGRPTLVVVNFKNTTWWTLRRWWTHLIRYHLKNHWYITDITLLIDIIIPLIYIFFFIFVNIALIRQNRPSHHPFFPKKSFPTFPEA